MALEQNLKARLDSLKTRRDPWLTQWQELADIFLPGKAYFTVKPYEGDRVNPSVYDGTPRLAARDLSSAIDGLIKPQTSNWFEPIVEDEKLADRPNVKIWLEHVRERMYRLIYSKDSRFVQRSAEVDDALVVFGWGSLFITENRNRNGLLFRSFHNKDVLIDEGPDGVVNTMAIIESLSARRAVERFGPDNLHKEIVEQANKEKGYATQLWDFAQMVLPREDYLANMLGLQGLPFASYVLDVKHEQILERGGFNEFPAAIPRWETQPLQIYPRSPAMIALPDSLTLQAISKTLLVGGERAADPPIMVANDSFVSPIRSFPGGVSVFDVQTLIDGGINSPIFPFPVSSSLPVGRDMQNDYRGIVQRAFYKDVLTLPVNNGQQTATEILERKEEFIRVLGPIFGRLETDYLGPIVERSFAIIDRGGGFLPRPEELMGVPIKFNFQSPIQQARKSLDVAGLGRTLEVLAPLIQLQPEIADNFDGNQVAKDSPEWSGIPQEWIRTDDEVDQIRQARSDAQNQQSQVDAAKPIADSIKSVAQARALTNPQEAVPA